jgi:hypothetical protein
MAFRCLLAFEKRASTSEAAQMKSVEIKRPTFLEIVDIQAHGLRDCINISANSQPVSMV